MTFSAMVVNCAVLVVVLFAEGSLCTKHFDTKMIGLTINTGGGGKKEDIVSSDRWIVYSRDKISFGAKVLMSNDTTLTEELRDIAVQEAHRLFVMYMDDRRCETKNARKGVLPAGSNTEQFLAADVGFECKYLPEVQDRKKTKIIIQMAPHEEPEHLVRVFDRQTSVPESVFADPIVEAAVARELAVKSYLTLRDVGMEAVPDVLAHILPTYSDLQIETATEQWRLYVTTPQEL